MRFWPRFNPRIYLDHASTTPLDPRVFSAMAKVYKNDYFNPGGLYREGVMTGRLVDDCRRSVAKLIGTTSEHVIFTRGGTESNNVAIKGVIEKITQSHLPLKEGATIIPHVVVSEIEHAAVLETVRDLERKGIIELSLAPVTSDGIVDIDALKKLLKPTTVLVSIMYVNNEIGTVQPIREIAKLIRWYKKQNSLKEYPLIHTDAIQAANYLDINVERLGVDLMSLSGSKIYGPKSSAILYVRSKDLLAPVVHGGEQEMGLRAGTEDVAQIVGFTTALQIAREMQECESARLFDLQNYFFAELQAKISGLIVNGTQDARIANNINISIPGISGERLVIELDAKGICASSKSACREDADEESHVIAAIRQAGDDHYFTKVEVAGSTEGSLRFSMGRKTTKGDVSKAVFELAKIVGKILKA